VGTAPVDRSAEQAGGEKASADKLTGEPPSGGPRLASVG
jgi:hypothetical protein